MVHGTHESEETPPRRTTARRLRPWREGQGLSPAQRADSSRDEVDTRRAQRHPVQAAVANRGRVDRVLHALTPGFRSTDGQRAHQTFPLEALALGFAIV